MSEKYDRRSLTLRPDQIEFIDELQDKDLISSRSAYIRSLIDRNRSARTAVILGSEDLR